MQWMTSSLDPCAMSGGTGRPETSGAFGNGLVPSGPGMFHRIQAHHRTTPVSAVLAQVRSRPPLKCPPGL
jgi:hypothetical protein